MKTQNNDAASQLSDISAEMKAIQDRTFPYLPLTVRTPIYYYHHISMRAQITEHMSSKDLGNMGMVNEKPPSQCASSFTDLITGTDLVTRGVGGVKVKLEEQDSENYYEAGDNEDHYEEDLTGGQEPVAKKICKVMVTMTPLKPDEIRSQNSNLFHNRVISRTHSRSDSSLPLLKVDTMPTRYTELDLDLTRYFY
ncbi:hypothetical protein L873DRAFT_1787277 [Choiromyces venosus 120613-1]|uniref:Uncharacterized protein n=1 Tax=Choiromyces venosus 120613-1 TaxID=1336337 RepID=A0A3N4K416_9PEZI|nr:hypothetical protein L873DRAFT_1787277 [Choiromyces venosus 120613-1]